MQMEGKMKKEILMTALFVLISISALNAAPLSFYENFTGQTINSSNPATIVGPGQLNSWQGFNWRVQTVGGNSFAQQGPLTSDNTNLLYYGLDGTNADSGQYTLSFDYISTNRGVELTVFAGLDFASGIQLDPFAPWFNEPNDGVTIINTNLPSTEVWKHVSIPFQITAPQASLFDAYVIAFAMGGTSGTRGVDNVTVAVTPEPASMLLLGAGFLGLLGFRRKPKE
jgi:hypothetical protein